MELLLIPFAAALLAIFVRGEGARYLALGATLLNLSVSLWRLVGFQTDGTFNYEINLPWIPEAGASFHLGFDGISMLLVLLTNLLAPIIVLSTWKRDFGQTERFYGLFLLMQGALVGVFSALDGLLFYVFWELALLPIYFICAIWGGENKNRITLKFFIYTFFGSLFMLASLIYLQQKAGSFDLNALYAVELAPGESLWVLLGFFLAFAIKMPIFPFHTWQPDTYTVAPTGGTMLLSGIMLKMGLYGVIRWMVPMAPEAFAQQGSWMIILAVIGIVYASVIAVQQSDLKRLIAYSSIAHVGLIAAGLLAFNREGLQGGLVQMLNHGINVVGLFLVSDILENRLGTRHLGQMGGVAKTAPRLALLFMVVMLGTVAVPLTNGFVGEFLLLNAVWQANAVLAAVAGLTIIFCAVYMLRAYQLSMFGPKGPLTENVADLDLVETVPLVVLVALILALGVFPQPVLDLTAGSVERLLQAAGL
jgi:NADH-quinone oxidoreductase subunit M